MDEKAPFTKNGYSVYEKRWVFILLMLVGGFWGGFTYSIRGGVFCNAQTGNLLRMGIAIGEGRWGDVSYFFVPLVAFISGTIISETVPHRIKPLGSIHWDTLFIFIEIISVIALGFLPETAPYQISQVWINFLCAMQYNTFRCAEGITMSTAFCTNHVRQIGIFCSKAVKNRNESDLHRMFAHIEMLVAFVIGVASASVLTRYWVGKAIWVTLLPLSIVFGNLLYADVKTVKIKIV